ncbi:hypothetical protein [Hoeflea sp. EC-HK425]|uniref:hypothetical protein n=1 Tax=Hoeflea sp. EC-HK425 TaxID=2038388 RepID=UPI001257D74D|nr:hypothetical protein [Hoeflea sp. EC-HK425]VVT05466.1 putative Membrane protein [Hoeflea sp. EC-HK425]
MTPLLFHRWNSAFLALFIILHFATHLTGVAGIEAYNTVQSALRLIYRNPVVEPFLLLSVVLQIGIGLLLLIRKTRRGLRGRWAYAQVISGFIVLFFLAQHLSAMALARWVEGLDTNFYWPASVMSGAPFIWYFLPYYFLGVVALFVHLGCGIRLALFRSNLRPYATVGFWALSTLGLAMAVTINLTLMGVFFEIELPPAWLTYLQGFVAGYTQ